MQRHLKWFVRNSTEKGSVENNIKDSTSGVTHDHGVLDRALPCFRLAACCLALASSSVLRARTGWLMRDAPRTPVFGVRRRRIRHHRGKWSLSEAARCFELVLLGLSGVLLVRQFLGCAADAFVRTEDTWSLCEAARQQCPFSEEGYQGLHCNVTHIFVFFWGFAHSPKVRTTCRYLPL